MRVGDLDCPGSLNPAFVRGNRAVFGIVLTFVLPERCPLKRTYHQNRGEQNLRIRSVLYGTFSRAPSRYEVEPCTGYCAVSRRIGTMRWT
jgi:hypothetical protein